MSRLLPLLLVPAIVLTACGDDVTNPAGAVGTSLLDTLPACEDGPDAVTGVSAAVELPPSTEVTERTEQGPLTYLSAYVPLTPADVRLWYESSDSLTVLTSEDEIVEVELLVTDGTNRAFLKGRAVCRTGTALTVVEAAEVEGAPDPAPDDAFRGTGD